MKGLDILGKRLAYGSLTIKFYIYMAFNLRRLKKYKKDKKLDRESVKYLCGIEYPGNVRELKNTVERLIIQSDDKN